MTVFEYTDYRIFLKDWYQKQKAIKASAFSFRSFARAAGYSSPNFLKLVMEGQRNLSSESIETFTRVLKLSRDEARFFRCLVQLNQASSTEEKERFGRQLLRSRRFKDCHPLKEAQYHYYSQWYFIPIREMVGSPLFVNDSKWIAKTLAPSITANEAQKAIEELKSLDLIREAPSGKLTQTHAILNTADEVTSASISQFHQEMIKKGAESIDRFPSTEREISAATVGVSEKNALRIKKLIQKFRKELLSISEESQEAERIYQINFQFFPLSHKLNSEGDDQ